MEKKAYLFDEFERREIEIPEEYKSKCQEAREALKEAEEAEQKAVKEASVKEAASLFAKPIVTTIEKLDIFYPAEDYHQDYFKKNPTAGYCNFVIRPKLKKFKQYLQN